MVKSNGLRKPVNGLEEVSLLSGRLVHDCMRRGERVLLYRQCVSYMYMYVDTFLSMIELLTITECEQIVVNTR